jgi:hypothetical protein
MARSSSTRTTSSARPSSSGSRRSACGQREPRSRQAQARGGGATHNERSTSQASADDQDIRHHAQRGIPVHLFVRVQKKLQGGGSAPFVYCGDVTFVDWHRDKPITVRWRLPEPVPEWLRGS